MNEKIVKPRVTRSKSAGGVVFYRDSILLLKKYSGGWVLPKGHIELGEDEEDAALREVYEEAGVSAQILEYLGQIDYSFKDSRICKGLIRKNVVWFVMRTDTMESKPQREEGFVKASFVDMDRAFDMAKHCDERRMIKNAIRLFSLKYKA